MSQKQTTTQTAQIAASGPRGLAGYCWTRHPNMVAFCNYPVGHEVRHRDHWNRFTGARWK